MRTQVLDSNILKNIKKAFMLQLLMLEAQPEEITLLTQCVQKENDTRCARELFAYVHRSYYCPLKKPSQF